MTDDPNPETAAPPSEFSGQAEQIETEQTNIVVPPSANNDGNRGHGNLKPWRPGQSGNLSGRPAIPAAIRALAREHTLEALNLLLGMARDPKVPPDIRRRCCNDLLDRAWGKTSIVVTQKGNPPVAPAGPLVNINMQRSGAAPLRHEHLAALADEGELLGQVVAGRLTPDAALQILATRAARTLPAAMPDSAQPQPPADAPDNVPLRSDS